MTGIDPTGSTVWIVQHTKRYVNGELILVHDTSKAEEYGQRETLLDETAKPWSPSNGIKAMRDRLVGHFNASTDFLLLIGSPVFIGPAFTIAVDATISAGFTHVRVLSWSGTHQNYTMITIAVADVVGSS